MEFKTMNNKGEITSSKIINQNKLTSDCWLIQFNGLLACKTCNLKNTDECGGGKTLKNMQSLTIPINEISNLNNEILSELEFDGDLTDLRLHTQHNWCFGCKTLKRFEKAENTLENYIIKGNGWELYPSYDVSGFDYWMLQQQEKISIGLTICFENINIDKKELKYIEKSLIKSYKFFDRFNKKYCYNPYTKRNEN